MPRRRARASGASCVLVALAAALGRPAAAESGLQLDPPSAVGVVPAATYDVERKRVGGAHLALEEGDDGNVRLLSESGFTGGAKTRLAAELVPVGNGKLRPLVQESRSFDAQGAPLGVLTVDHRTRQASCHDGNGKLVGRIELPPEDRVANVSLHLLFRPLARGEADEVHFQIFLCGGGPRLIDFVANAVAGSGNGSGRLREVRYGPDFGIATLMAQSFLPKLSFWYDPDHPGRWMAHRVPLYGDGPEVFVVRDGVPPRWLADE